MNTDTTTVWHLLTRVNPLNIAFAIFLSTVITAVGLGIFYFLLIEPNESLMGDYESPRPILTRVPGIPGPAVKTHGIVTMRASRCINRQKLIQVEVSQNIVNDSGVKVLDFSRASQTRAPGCTLMDIQVTLPEAVVPGMWRIEGAEGVPTTGEIRYWFSEYFTVIN